MLPFLLFPRLLFLVLPYFLMPLDMREAQCLEAWVQISALIQVMEYFITLANKVYDIAELKV